MTRCTLCRQPEQLPQTFWPGGLEPTPLPGTGYRCIDHDACAARVRGIVAAHKGLGEVCGG